MEFVFIVPVIVLLILGIISFGLVIYESSALQGALNNAAREGKTGSPDPSDPGTLNGARWKNTSSIFTTETKAMFDSTKITYAVTSYPNFTDAINNTGGTANSVGASGSVVIYTATYPYPNIPLIQTMFGKNAKMTTNCIVKNEAF